MSTLTFHRATTIAAATLFAAAGAAHAGAVVSFGYTELSGSYDHGTGVFEAVSVDAGVFSTSGDVTRLVGPGEGTALFNPGSFDGSTLASVEFTVNVSNVGTNTADGVGSFRIVDVDGDEIVGNFTGTWSTPGLGFTFFNASSADITFSDAGIGNGSFDGASGGSFDSSSLSGLFDGALTLLFQVPNFSFFNSSFQDLSTQTTGVIIPAPAGMLAFGVLAAGAVRRRRR